MRVLVDRGRLLERRSNNLFGTEGFCYIKGEDIIKVYYKPKNIDNYVDFSSYSSKYIAFPKFYLIDENNMITGEVMKYIPKLSIIESINENCDYLHLLKNYREIIKEFMKYKEINMEDLCTPNILYSEDGFHLIDTTDWKIDSDPNNYQNNRESFDSDLCEILIDGILEITYLDLYISSSFNTNLRKYGKLGQDLFRLIHLSSKGCYPFEEILELYRIIMEEKEGIPLKIIEDMAKYTKILKKG